MPLSAAGTYNTAGGSYSDVTGGAFVGELDNYGFAAGGSYSSRPGPGVFHSP